MDGQDAADGQNLLNKRVFDANVYFERMPESPRPHDGYDRPFHVMAMPTGPTCNLDCDYCYYLEKTELYPERSDFRMSTETLEEFVKQYIESQPGSQVTFAWQGGEPTLRGLDFYRDAVRLQRKHAPADKRIINTLQTNGTRLDDEWCRFFASNDFLVGISVDGPRELHNQFRKTRGDGSTFEEVTNGLTLLQKHGVQYNVLCVLNRYNSQHPLRVYRFFKERGVQWLQFIPLVEPVDTPAAETVAADASREGDTSGGDEQFGGRHPWPPDRTESLECADDGYREVLTRAREASVTSRTVDPERYGDFMCAVFDEWVRNDVGELSVRLFDQCLEIEARGEASYCVHRETCGDQLAIEHGGDVYACDHYVDDGFKRGNVHDDHLVDMATSDEQKQFGNYKRDGLPSRCRECDVLEFCHGGCPKDRHIGTPDGEPGLNYLCAGYRRFFDHVRPYLRIFERVLRGNRSIPAVMDEVTALDERAASG